MASTEISRPSISFRGVSVAVVTPFTPDLKDLDLTTFADLIEWQITSGVDAIVVGGTTGEPFAVTSEEFVMLLVTAVRVAANRVPIIAGTGTSSTASTIAKTHLALTCGATAALVVTPPFVKPTQEGLHEHYAQLAAAVPDMPIILYNVPGRAGVDMAVDTVCGLKDIPNIVAVKEGSSDLMKYETLRSAVGDKLEVLVGEDAAGCEGLLAGADGLMSVVGNVAPGLVKEMTDAALRRDEGRARELNEKMKNLQKWIFAEPSPIPVKWGLHAIGRIPNPAPRMPLMPLKEIHHEPLRNALKEAGCPLAGGA